MSDEWGGMFEAAEAFAALPDCPTCGGSGKNEHDAVNLVQAANDLLAEHHEVARYRGSGVRCACGALIRQIRAEQPTWQEHYVQVLAEAGLLVPGERPQTAEWQRRAANATGAAEHAVGQVAEREGRWQ